MTWGAIGSSVAGAVVGGMMTDSGGGGSQTASKEPWAEAAPWLKSLIGQGQNLQGYYQDNPFSYLQQAAYADLFNQSDYFNRAAPGLMSQFSRQTGFDRSNPLAKPQAFQFPTMPAPGSWGGATPMAGLLGDMSVKQNPMRNGLLATQAPAAPAPAAGPAPGTLDYFAQNGNFGVDYNGQGA